MPGGEDVGPSSSLPAGPSCARAAKATDAAPPVGYQARAAVRCWGTNQLSTDPVVGRSVSIVRLDTGEILRVFARLADAPATDTLKHAGRITDTPFDSPMTGTAMVYPVDVGTNTTKAFLGDADGTVWRIDLSSSNPAQWRAELFLDLYNTTFDTSATSWGDGQTLEVTPVLSLDPAGELVLNIATGSTEQYDNTGLEGVTSVTEKVQGSPAKFRAKVNWWLGQPTFQPGERVSGPMSVFTGTLYFSTYSAAPPRAQVCTGGLARSSGGATSLRRTTRRTSRRVACENCSLLRRIRRSALRPYMSNRAITIQRCSAKSSRECPSRPRQPAQALGHRATIRTFTEPRTRLRRTTAPVPSRSSLRWARREPAERPHARSTSRCRPPCRRP